MYEQFYGFSALPFSLLPDADFLFLSTRHKKAINLLEYGIMSRAGFIVLTGDVGAGKTTVIRRFLKQADDSITVGVISNPSKTFGQLLNWIALAFEFPESADQAKAYDNFVAYLIDQYARGKRAVLIIDEAQNLSPEMLEELRMLSNVNNEKDQLLQMVLVGQPELLEMLNRPELRQFAQRISIHSHLDPLTAPETATYIRHRLMVVGGAPEIFDDESCAAVHYFSNGVPRLINLLCDQSLVYSFSEDMGHVEAEMIAEVAQDRMRGGLSAFRPLPEWDMFHLRQALVPVLAEIRTAQGTGPKNGF